MDSYAQNTPVIAQGARSKHAEAKHSRALLVVRPRRPGHAESDCDKD